MATIFQAKGWTPKPDRPVQGYWTRWCLERPCATHGWVAVLDSACARVAAAHGPAWWKPRYAQIIAIHGALEVLGLSQATLAAWGDPRTWANGGIHTTGLLPPDLSAFGQHWVGRHAAKGWPNDVILAVGHMRLHPGTTPLWAQPAWDMLRALQAHGCPHGQGWALAHTTEGKEPNRDPARATAHTKLLTHQTYGAPQPWPAEEARLTLAVAAYATTPPDSPTAWIP